SSVVGIVLNEPSGLKTNYATIVAALAASSSGDTVYAGPGTYAESFTVPAGVTLVGQGGSRVTKITGALATGTRITLSNGAFLKGFTITLPTDATYAIQYAGAAPSLAISRDIVFIGAGASGKCYGQTGTGSSEIMDVFVQQGSMAAVYEVTNGELLVRETLVSKYITNITDLCAVSGGLLAIEAFIARGSGIVDGLSVGAGQVIGTVIEFQDLSGSAIHLTSDSADCQLRSIRCDGCNKDVEVDAALTTAKLHVIGGELLQSKIDVPDAWHGADHFLMFQDEKPGDAALKIWGELHVGSHVHGTTSSFGEGSAHTDGMYCFRNTNLEVGTWSDISSIYSSADSSSATIFAGTAAGNCFYIGDDAKEFSGHYANVTVAGTLGAGALIVEYWNGAAWTPMAIMAADSVAPHAQHGADISELDGELNLRFGPMSGWATKALDGTTAYWVRYRITTGWTTSPTCEQMKIAINAVEIGEEGFLEFFGLARPERNVIWHLSLLDDAVGQDAANENVRFSTNVGIALLDNEFTDGVTDGRAGVIEIPFGLDTSYPLTVTLFWAQNQSGLGDVDFSFYYSKAQVGDRFLGTGTETLISSIESVTGLADQSYVLEVSIPVYDMVPGQLLGIACSRDASAGNLDDTFGGNAYIIASSAKGHFWR
ncbi:MAG: hypothetical protein DRP01_08430, partial [Archaeoglobales archaeon]